MRALMSVSVDLTSLLICHIDTDALVTRHIAYHSIKKRAESSSKNFQPNHNHQKSNHFCFTETDISALILLAEIYQLASCHKPYALVGAHELQKFTEHGETSRTSG